MDVDLQTKGAAGRLDVDLQMRGVAGRLDVVSWLRGVAKKVGRLDAELILAEVLGEERVWLHGHGERELTDSEVVVADGMVGRRAEGEPLAYILGWKEFLGRRFEVNAAVLVPRPETEVLVEVALGHPFGIDGDRICVLDVGTGSGVIGVSVALELPEVEVLAVDVSLEALEVAEENASRLRATNISFLQSDLLEGLRGARVRRFEVIVANLPYVDKDWGWNAPGLAYEPQGALYAEDGGLKLIKRLLREAPEYLEDGGILVLEADVSQHAKVGKFARECGWEVMLVRGLALVLRRR